MNKVMKLTVKILSLCGIVGFFLPMFQIGAGEKTSASFFQLVMGGISVGDQTISNQYWLIIFIAVPVMIFLLPFSRRRESKRTEILDLTGALFDFDLMLVLLLIKGEGTFLETDYRHTLFFYILLGVYGVSLLLLIVVTGRTKGALTTVSTREEPAKEITKEPAKEIAKEPVKSLEDEFGEDIHKEYDTKVCPKCGRTIPDFSKFCPYCGIDLREI